MEAEFSLENYLKRKITRIKLLGTPDYRHPDGLDPCTWEIYYKDDPLDEREHTIVEIGLDKAEALSNALQTMVRYYQKGYIK